MFESELYDLEIRHLLRKPVVIESCEGHRVTVDGKRLLLMCSNDYLGLSGHPSLRNAAIEAMDRFGFGAGASRLISGTSGIHRELEHRISRYKGTEAAILFNSGYAANTGIIPALAQEGDAILSDALNHASIIDGCRLSRAQVTVYRHKDMNHLENLLKQTRPAKRRLIITDGVFSMDGDIAPLPDIITLAGRYHALVMVDDAHATGILGKTGRGTAEHFGLAGSVPVQMGTLGKAFGSLGAYATGDRDVVDYLMNRSRSYIFSTALPPAVCAAAVSAIDLAENEPERRASLWRVRERLASGLRALGIPVGDSESPIIPLVVGESGKALSASKRLFDLGIFASAIRPPSVPEGTARIRMTVTSLHTDADIDCALAALKTCREEGLLP